MASRATAARRHVLAEGATYDRLTVLKHDVEADGPFVRVQCTCGKTRSVRACHLVSGKTRSCGCLARELASERLRGVAGADRRAAAEALRRSGAAPRPRAAPADDPARLPADRRAVAEAVWEWRVRNGCDPSPAERAVVETAAALADGEARSAAEVARACGVKIATALARLTRHPELAARGPDRLWRKTT